MDTEIEKIHEQPTITQGQGDVNNKDEKVHVIGFARSTWSYSWFLSEYTNIRPIKVLPIILIFLFPCLHILLTFLNCLLIYFFCLYFLSLSKSHHDFSALFLALFLCVCFFL